MGVGTEPRHRRPGGTAHDAYAATNPLRNRSRQRSRVASPPPFLFFLRSDVCPVIPLPPGPLSRLDGARVPCSAAASTRSSTPVDLSLPNPAPLRLMLPDCAVLVREPVLHSRFAMVGGDGSQCDLGRCGHLSAGCCSCLFSDFSCSFRWGR